jgi:flagellin
MSLFINTNSEAMVAQNNLSTTESSLNTAMTDLSSGLRINTAADDAAGYAITEDLTSQVNGLDQANSNAQDATSLVQTADGALNDVGQMLQRVRELAVEYQGGTLDSTDQNAIVSEVQQLSSQIEQIGNQAQFNGISLFAPNGSTGTGNLTFQVGANDGGSSPSRCRLWWAHTASSA